MTYLWLKAFHIIFVVCWFAGIFYLPRILVYYAASDEEATRGTLRIMARKLYRFVTPFMFLSILLDIFSHHQQCYLVIYHYYCGRLVRAVESDTDAHSHIYFRVFNEVPVLFLFFIVIFAILKPF